jgi:hypothetical protein
LIAPVAAAARGCNHRCGYVVHRYARDRTIVNSGGIGWDTSADVGLCLR